MKHRSLTLLFFTSLALKALAQEPQTEPAPPTLSPTEIKERTSLALGHREGTRAAQRLIHADDLHPDSFLKGFLRGLANQPLALSPEDIREALIALENQIAARELELAQQNIQAGAAYLAAKAQETGVQSAEAGFLFEVLAPGEGEPHGLDHLLTRNVLVHFQTTLPDGTEVASSGGDLPAQLKVKDLVPGFRIALGMMPVGAKWRIHLPAELAYGDQRRNTQIGPQQALVFEIEFLKIVEDQEPTS